MAKCPARFTEKVFFEKQLVVLVVVTDFENQLVDVEQICTRHLQLITHPQMQ